ncbi:MAG: hypothetical protein WCD31_05195 [Gillisia sp.]
MKWVLRILGILILIALAVGFYFRIIDNIALGDKIIGSAVLVSVFILMPIFLVVRWRGKKLSDYTLTKENMDKMKDRGID